MAISILKKTEKSFTLEEFKRKYKNIIGDNLDKVVEVLKTSDIVYVTNTSAIPMTFKEYVYSIDDDKGAYRSSNIYNRLALKKYKKLIIETVTPQDDNKKTLVMNSLIHITDEESEWYKINNEEESKFDHIFR